MRGCRAIFDWSSSVPVLKTFSNWVHSFPSFSRFYVLSNILAPLRFPIPLKFVTSLSKWVWGERSIQSRSEKENMSWIFRASWQTFSWSNQRSRIQGNRDQYGSQRFLILGRCSLSSGSQPEALSLFIPEFPFRAFSNPFPIHWFKRKNLLSV